MTLTDGTSDEEFRLPPGVVILLQVMIALVYIIPIESIPELSGQVRLRWLEPFLYLTPLLTLLLYHWQPVVGRWFSVLAPGAIIVGMHIWLPIPGSLALLAISTGVAGGFIGPRAAAATAAGSILALVGLRSLTGAPDFWQIGIALIAVLTTLVLTLSLHRAAKDLTSWSRGYYQEAVRIMQENRERQGDLQQALDDLAHANRQMTLLYEKQTFLQRIAEEAERTKSAFVAKVSHEFRTPLNMIIGLASVMIENPQMYGRALPAALVEDLRIIYRNCDHLASLVNDVLDLSQLQSGGVVLRRENLNLVEIIQNALDVIRPLVNQKKLHLTLELPEQMSPVSCDRTRIRQVILNLLSNAARFTDHGGITVQVTMEERQVVIAVSDTGPGILPEDKERIFEPFCQGSEQVWREKVGSGLGLTISKQFVELHGGRIWLESELGRGTTFFVALPVQAPLMPVRLPAGWISPEWKWNERNGAAQLPRLPDRPRVVIYDPTQEISQGISSYAEQLEVVTGGSLEEVIAEAQKTPAHAVLLGANAAEGLQPLMQAGAQELPDTPLFGWALPQRMSPALRAGADHYLVKPISLAGLRQKLQSFDKPVRQILIADDDDETRLLLARMLKLYDADLRIKTAADGEQALVILKNEAVDLLLLDVMMPEVNGLQVLERVRGDEQLRDLPVIVISAQDLYETSPVCAELVMMLGSGVSLPKALECVIGVSQILFTPVAEPHPVPG